MTRIIKPSLKTLVVVSTIKRMEISCNYIYPLPRDVFFSHISMASMTTFPGTNVIVKKTNWVE